MKFFVPVVAAAMAVASEARMLTVGNFRTVETFHLDLSSSKNTGGLRSVGSGDSWKVTKKVGQMAGLMVDISGLGAYGHLNGQMATHVSALDRSTEYDMIREEFGVGGGISAFWSWLGISAKTEYEKEKIKETFRQISKALSVNATVEVDLMATGYAPNVAVQAGAYVVAMEIEDSQGNKYTAMSDRGAADDVFAGDTENGGARLPEKDNESTITFD